MLAEMREGQERMEVIVVVPSYYLYLPSAQSPNDGREVQVRVVNT